ncbi:MAG: zinc-binding dehydrogenase [Armatimonadetes bacterium]|nr:zinc-binding dehydrogenase [Armatimonadota bacterium]
MTGKAMVLEAFKQPLVEQSFEVSDLAPGEVRCRISAAGVCGSDVHMWHGNDPRTPLPMILGHEGVGTIVETAGEKLDLFGRPLKPGDLVVWERGLMCGQCYYCVVRKQPALCPNRKTYGISLGCSEPPHFSGCYGEYLHLRARCHMLRIEEPIDPAVLVAATCSGATAAHAVQLSKVTPGDAVLIVGPGPVGIFCLAMALQAGASAVYVAGTSADRARLDLCLEFGASDALVVDETTAEERAAFLRERTHGVGVNAVIDCTGTPRSIPDNLPLVAPYGTYSIPGIATPVGELPIALFEHLARKNVNLQGVWVSDTAHLYQSIRLVLTGRYPFEKLVTHRFPLAQADEALRVMESKAAIKAVLLP